MMSACKRDSHPSKKNYQITYFFVFTEKFRLDGFLFGDERWATFDQSHCVWALHVEIFQKDGGQRRGNRLVAIARVLQIFPTNERLT